jgi:hypothetical protein
MLGFVKGILSDKGHIKRNTIIQIVVVTIAIILLARIYPFSAVQSHNTSKQQAFKTLSLRSISGEEFTAKDKKLQMVNFTDSHIYQIKLYLTAKLPEYVSSAQRITFRLYDENFSCIDSEDISLFKIEKRGYLKATPDLDVEVGKAYYYEILVPEDCEAVIELPTASRESLDQPENSTLFIDGIINYDVSLVADFTYSKALNAIGILFRYIVIIALAMLAYVGIVYCFDIYEEKFSDYDGKVKRIAKIIVSMAIVLAGIYVIIYSVILNKFGSPMLDRGVYLAAVLSALFWSLGAMWFPRYYPKAKRDFTRPLIWKNYIQTVSFGLLFYALCQYVNADREFYHQTNTRWMLIFLAIAFLMLLGGKTMINKVSAAWVTLGWLFSVMYCQGFRAEEKEYLLTRLTCGVVVVWGLLIINLIIGLRNQNIKSVISVGTVKAYVYKHKLQTVYFAVWVLFALLMYAYRYEKVWVFTATLPFVSLFFVRLTPQVKSRLLNNLTNGIILSFWLVTLFCLIHRPHHYWMLYRYSGIFHTVACTGMYLAVVFAAAVGRLYGRLRDRKNMFLRCYYDFFLIGCVVGFIILTMSRTAFVTIALCAILVAVLTAFIYQKGIGRIVQEFAVLAASIVVCFPLVYTAVRTIPAVINDPVRYEIEFQDDSFMICAGDPIYSDKYMTMERFATILFGRFGSDKSDSDEEAAAYIESETLLAYTGSDFSNMGKIYISDANDEATDDEEADENETTDISNGRFDVFKAYIKATSFKGHPEMAVVTEDGVEYTHAHNSYLQVFYDFGIIAGVMFLIMCAFSVWKSADIAIRLGRKYSVFFVPFALIIAFGLVSVTEWAFHPCIPAGFCFLLMQVILIKDY